MEMIVLVLMIAFVAIALGGNMALIYVLSKPFEGEWKIQPRAFALNLQARQMLRESTLLDPAQARSIPLKPRTSNLSPSPGQPKQDQ